MFTNNYAVATDEQNTDEKAMKELERELELSLEETMEKVEVKHNEVPAIDLLAYQNSYLNAAVEEGRHFWIGAGIRSSYNFGTQNGLEVQLGYQWSILGADIEVNKSSMTFGSIFVLPDSDADSDGFDSAASPFSELNRERFSSDRWEMLTIEPGFSINGNIFAFDMPQLSQKARFGVGAGNFKDLKNNVSFSGLVFSTELAFQYHFKSFAIETGTKISWGRIISKQDPSGQAGRLPIIYSNFHFLTIFWF